MPTTREDEFMKTTSLIALLTLGVMGPALAADNGMITKPSKYPVAETVTRIEDVLKAKGVTLFARIDHSGEAQKAGLTMRPTQLLIFGNPKAGTPVMNAAPTAAIDLPLKTLVWEDAQGKVWVAHNSADYLAQRHGIAPDLAKPLGAPGMLIDQALQ
jgi:uncharacterized protein (DUF302 family)